jgi:hypothetical protein
MVERVFIAGVPVSSELVLALARLVKDPELAAKLEQRVRRDLVVIRLDDRERTIVLKALAEPPTGLEDVRAALLEEEARWEPELLEAADSAA